MSQSDGKQNANRFHRGGATSINISLNDLSGRPSICVIQEKKRIREKSSYKRGESDNLRCYQVIRAMKNESFDYDVVG
jgi:hypothetical protein